MRTCNLFISTLLVLLTFGLAAEARTANTGAISGAITDSLSRFERRDVAEIWFDENHRRESPVFRNLVK